jgi:hypothetical protein
MQTLMTNLECEVPRVTDGSVDHHDARECEPQHELLAVRSSLTLCDVRVALTLVIGDRGVHVSVRVGSGPECRLQSELDDQPA